MPASKGLHRLDTIAVVNNYLLSTSKSVLSTTKERVWDEVSTTKRWILIVVDN